MKQIILISTIHREQGVCTSEKFVDILERINPEVIFEEIHPDRFDLYYIEKNMKTLETNAISIYIKNHKITQVPVDDYDLSTIKEKYIKIGNILNEIDESSDEINCIIENQTINIYKQGFVFINSFENDFVNNKIDRLREEYVNKSNNNHIKEKYSLWLDLNKTREKGMLDNIYDYCCDNEFHKGLFIVGSGHRNSLIKGIENNFTTDGNISWIYNDYSSIL